MSSEAVRELLAILDLEQLEDNLFRGRSPEGATQRVFGGQVAGQALVAAGRTVDPQRRVHSLHAYFLRPGDPAIPMVYDVDRTRDGRSFTTRRVTAIQHGRPIFTMSASFQSDEQGVEHAAEMPEVAPPEGLPTFQERHAAYANEVEWYSRRLPIDIRYVGDPPRVAMGQPRPPRQRVWLRVDGELPDDPLLHVCAVTYASDLTLLDSVLIAHGLAWWTGEVDGASLDHAVWFHRPFRADEWLLYDQESPSASGARGLATGRIFSRDGRLLVSVVQEGLFRVRGD